MSYFLGTPTFELSTRSKRSRWNRNSYYWWIISWIGTEKWSFKWSWHCFNNWVSVIIIEENCMRKLEQAAIVKKSSSVNWRIKLPQRSLMPLGSKKPRLVGLNAKSSFKWNGWKMDKTERTMKNDSGKAGHRRSERERSKWIQVNPWKFRTRSPPPSCSSMAIEIGLEHSCRNWPLHYLR